MEKPPENKESPFKELAGKLDKLQAEKNSGMGVSCVRDVITYLRLGKVLEAKSVASHDHDKIRNYPDIQKLLQEQLFDGVEFWRWTPDSDKKDLSP